MSRPVDLYGEMAQALAHPASRNWSGVARVRLDGDELYCPDPHGPIQAAIVAVMPDDFIIDLVAIDLHEPHKWCLRLGIADLLGEANLLGLSFTGEPLVVHRGPAEWLNAGGEGVAVLEWRPSVVGLLSAIKGGLIAANADHGVEIQQRLIEVSKPTLPPIFVTHDRRAVA